MKLKKLLLTLCILALSGCISGAVQQGGYSGQDAAYLIAGQHKELEILTQKSTTVRIMNVNGQPTKSNRFNAGSVSVAPGIKHIAIRLWGHAPGFGPRGSIAFICITLNVLAGNTYLFSGEITEKEYKLVLHEKTSAGLKLIESFPVNFTNTIPSSGCNLA